MIDTVYCIQVTVDGITVDHVEGDRDNAEARYKVAQAKYGPRNVTMWKAFDIVWDQADPTPIYAAV